MSKKSEGYVIIGYTANDVMPEKDTFAEVMNAPVEPKEEPKEEPKKEAPKAVPRGNIRGHKK